jgi:hypothetical protein
MNKNIVITVVLVLVAIFGIGVSYVGKSSKTAADTTVVDTVADTTKVDTVVVADSVDTTKIDSAK